MNNPTLIFCIATFVIFPIAMVLAYRTQKYGTFGRAWCRTFHTHRESKLGHRIKRCTSCKRPWHG